MSYQESWIISRSQSDFNELLAAYARAKEKGLYKDNTCNAEPVYIVQLKKDVPGIPNKGIPVIWVAGEQSACNIEGVFWNELPKQCVPTFVPIKVIKKYSPELFDDINYKDNTATDTCHLKMNPIDVYVNDYMTENHSVKVLSKDALTAKKKEERDNLSQLAENMEKQIAASSEGFRSYLESLARFERYSTSNILLILEQRPDATQIGDYEYWKSASSPVLKGEKSFSIFEPGSEYRREDGTVGVAMNVKKVFDISQTSAKDRAEEPKETPIKELLSALLRTATPDTVLVDKLQDGVGARYDERRKKIKVIQGLDERSYFRCLTQEVAYAELDHRSQTESFKCQSKSFVAYAVSYVLCTKHSIDTQGYDFATAPAYFIGAKKGSVLKELSVIRDTVNIISGRMAKVLGKPEKTSVQAAR